MVGQLVTDKSGSIWFRYQALQLQSVVTNNRVRGNWKLTTPTKRAQERAFRTTREFSFNMIQFRRSHHRNFIIRSNLDRNRSLSNRRQHLIRFYRGTDPCFQTEPD